MNRTHLFGDLGVVALDEEEITAIRGGLGPLLASIIAGMFVAIISDVDAFIEGCKEGYAAGRS